ncbi:MAG: hypothetical protein HFP77_03870, partial [Methylococcales symbiont of Iophon sp. n. MRB-2018]
ASTLDPDVLLSVASGLTLIKTETVISKPIDPAVVFQALEDNRKAGTLQKSVTASTVHYQASTTQLGCLEQIDSNGNSRIGQFKNGQFIELNR